MKTYTDSDLIKFAMAPSVTEGKQLVRSSNMVKAIQPTMEEITGYELSVTQKGSYSLSTNIGRSSDMDLSVRLVGHSFFVKYPDRMSREEGHRIFRHCNSTYTSEHYWQDIEESISKTLKYSKSSKCFTVAENTYHSECDIVPVHDYFWFKEVGVAPTTGIAISSNYGKGPLVINWPTQNVEAVLELNKLTDSEFRKMVRTLKNIRKDLLEERSSNPGYLKNIPGYLCDCLVSNADVDYAGMSAPIQRLKFIIDNLDMKIQTSANSMTELNKIKPLFSDGNGTIQKWSETDVRIFLADVKGSL